MGHIAHPALLLPPALMAEVEALAATEQRSAREMLVEAVELYVQDRRSAAFARDPRSKRAPQQAAERMLERRKLHRLPAGMSIRDLLIDGRA